MNPHEILGVKSDASKDDIKKAYRKLAKDSHPDKNGGDDTKFKKITNAYEILTDPKANRNWKREQATRSHSHPFNANPFGGNRHPSVDDIMNDFLKNGGFGFDMNTGDKRYHTNIKKKIHGQDIKVKINLTLEDAFHGKVVEIRIERQERTTPEKRHPSIKKIKITIPKGAKNEQQLILRNQGNQGLGGGRDGDIVVILNVKPHNYFIRKDHDLFATIKVPFTQLVLGDVVRFKNINGEMVKVVIHQYCNDGDIIEIREKGMPIGNSAARGYLKLIVSVEMPKNLTDEHLEVFKAIQEQQGRKKEVKPESII